MSTNLRDKFLLDENGEPLSDEEIDRRLKRLEGARMVDAGDDMVAIMPDMNIVKGMCQAAEHIAEITKNNSPAVMAATFISAAWMYLGVKAGMPPHMRKAMLLAFVDSMMSVPGKDRQQ